MKNILVVSNPFGYGPTGKAIRLIEDLNKLFLQNNQEVKLFFAGSELCTEIVRKKEGFNIVNVDERDHLALKEVILSLPKIDLCVGVQNRFIPKVCKELNIQCYFIDGLAWFWKDYPAEHLVADRIFWTDFPRIHEKILNYKIDIIGDLTTSIKAVDQKKEYILVCLGGQKNPLRGGLQENYLHLVHEVFNQISRNNNQNVIITAGKEAVEFLSQIEGNKYLVYKNVDHDEMMNLLGSCRKFFSLGGQSSTFEALASHVPTEFFLASNLSQVALQKAFNSNTKWKKYVNVPEGFLNFTEKDAINVIEDLSYKIINTHNLFIQLVSDTYANLKNDKSKLEQVYDQIKKNGATDSYNSIVKDIFK